MCKTTYNTDDATDQYVSYEENLIVAHGPCHRHAVIPLSRDCISTVRIMISKTLFLLKWTATVDRRWPNTISDSVDALLVLGSTSIIAKQPYLHVGTATACNSFIIVNHEQNTYVCIYVLLIIALVHDSPLYVM